MKTGTKNLIFHGHLKGVYVVDVTAWCLHSMFMTVYIILKS